MKPHLYELLWDMETDLCSFFYREFKVFSSDAEAKQYGMRRETELNGGASIEESAQDGYYFKYYSACKVREIDGFVVNLTSARPPVFGCAADGPGTGLRASVVEG